jgi:RRXRR protein
MFVYVRNQDGRPLMPCTPTKARKLLRAWKASVVKRSPFTIQLSWLCEGHVQQVRAGIDKGSSTTGICCIGNGQALFSAEIHHRKDVKEKMDDRPSILHPREK